MERLATWEENDAGRRKAAKHALTELIRKKAEGFVPKRKQATNTTDVVPVPFELLSSHFAAGVDAGLGNLEELWGDITSSHPDILNRLDRISLALEKLPPGSVKHDATTSPWKKARQHRETATILKHYAIAAQALESIDSPQALALAKQSAKGPTAHHALPLHAVYMAGAAQAHNASAAQRTRTSDILMKNINSPKHRAWASYIERSDALMQAGRLRDAGTLIQQGFGIFKEAPQAWPYTIAVVGKTQGWKNAKQLAAACVQRFPLEAERCTHAARSPMEQMQQQKETEAKAEQLLQKILKW